MTDSKANQLIADLRQRTIELSVMTEQMFFRAEKIKSLNILLTNEKAIVKRRESTIDTQLQELHRLRTRNLWQRILNK